MSKFALQQRLIKLQIQLQSTSSLQASAFFAKQIAKINTQLAELNK